MNDTPARLMRQREPYSYQRRRNTIHWNYPRASQPNTNQPNQRPLQGWGMSSLEYWSAVYQKYLNRRGASWRTNLALGRR